MERAVCPNCGSYAVYDRINYLETVDCYNCGYHYQGNIIQGEEPSVVLQNIGVIHIEHPNNGEIYMVKDQAQKDKILSWIKEEKIAQPIIRAFFTYYKNNQLMEETIC